MFQGTLKAFTVPILPIISRLYFPFCIFFMGTYYGNPEKSFPFHPSLKHFLKFFTVFSDFFGGKHYKNSFPFFFPFLSSFLPFFPFFFFPPLLPCFFPFFLLSPLLKEKLFKIQIFVDKKGNGKQKKIVKKARRNLPNRNVPNLYYSNFRL